MKLIDFDDHFTQALTDWMETGSAGYKSADAMEDAAPEFYLKWLATPAPWLDGAAPGTYFAQYEDMQALVDLMVDYVRQDVPVPDPLLDRLQELADEKPVLALVRDQSAPVEARMLGIELLRQLESNAPLVDYIRWQVERSEDEELLDNALESLHNMSADVFRPAKLAFQAANDTGKEALLDLLSDFPCDEDVLAFAIRQFQQLPERRALYAGYLGKLGDDRALESLLDAAESNTVSYIDFIEIRNAIERLGGEAPVRDFTGDPTWAAVKRLQKR